VLVVDNVTLHIDDAAIRTCSTIIAGILCRFMSHWRPAKVCAAAASATGN